MTQRDQFIIPCLTTERLLLRPFNEHDLDAFTEIVADPEVIRYATYTGGEMSRGQAWNWLCMMLGHWLMRGFGVWAVEELESGELLGRIGLQHLEWFDDVELVWMLKRSAWGKGFASEGARAAIRYGFEVLGLSRMTAIIHTINEPSIRLAERLGMSFERQIERQEIQFLEFSITEQKFEGEGYPGK